VKPTEKLDFRTVYEAWFHSVERWLRAAGAPDSELEDLAQEVFVVVERKLHRFDGKNLPGWLYRICANTVSDHRRRAWFRRLFTRPRDFALESVEQEGGDPAELFEKEEERAQLHRLLDKMSEKRRTAFVLFEIEGYSCEEIAGILGIPIATVWTRLHHARKEFLDLVGKHARKEVR
jgi:RNA polymerase sigma-70 factor (ECF subfamily)